MSVSELRICLPEDVKQIINTLTEHGFEAYAVGGCVRDSILHKEPKDWDITTSARPQQVKELFRRTIDTGIQHGTVTVMIGKNGYEVTTYRIDGEYEDGRHPKSVEFSDNLLEDLKRRDFTINAMAYNDYAGLVDAFDGAGDIERRVIRCVRDAGERFTEDALRMMRAVRFSAQLGFDIEEATFQAVCRLAPNISMVSRERIQVEFSKTILSGCPQYLRKYEESGILSHVLPVMHEIMTSDRREQVLEMVQTVPDILAVRYAALLFPAGRDRAEEELRGLRLDNQTISLCCKLISVMEVQMPETESDMRRFLCRFNADFWPVYRPFMKSFYEACVEESQEPIQKLELADAMYKVIVERGDCVSLKQLAVGGKDLMECGMERGSRIGEVLEELLQAVLEDPSKNKREILLGMANLAK